MGGRGASLHHPDEDSTDGRNLGRHVHYQRHDGAGPDSGCKRVLPRQRSDALVVSIQTNPQTRKPADGSVLTFDTHFNVMMLSRRRRAAISTFCASTLRRCSKSVSLQLRLRSSSATILSVFSFPASCLSAP